MNQAVNKNIPKLRFSEFINSWQDKKLSEILNYEPREINKPEKTFLSIGIRSHFKGTFQKSNFDPNTIEMDKLFIVKVNDLVVNITFAWEGAVAIAGKEDDDGLVSHRFPTFTFKDNLVTSKFFRYLYPTKRFLYELGLASPGGAGRNRVLSKNDFLEIEFKIPDIKEQEKVADFLTAVDERIFNMQRKLELLKKYKKGVVQKIFSQEVRFKDEDGEVYPDWQEKRLGEISTFRRGSFPQPYGLPKWYDEINGAPFVQVFDVDSNMKLKSKTKLKISDLAKPMSVFVKKGTVILTIQGSIGRIAVTQYDSYVDRTLLIFQSFKVPIDKFYFLYIVYLLFELEKQKAPGGTIKTITKEVLTNFKIKLPILEEQQKIAEFLISIDNIIQHQERKLEETNKFKKSLLQQMFV